MNELVENITRALVKNPDAVSVNVVHKGSLEQCDFSRIEGGTFRYGQGDWQKRPHC